LGISCFGNGTIGGKRACFVAANAPSTSNMLELTCENRNRVFSSV
jgi:hypothetical protein